MVMLWVFRIGMALAGLVVGAFCFTNVKQSILRMRKKFFSSFISAFIWVLVAAAGYVCVKMLLPAYVLWYLIGCALGVIVGLTS